MTTRGIRDYSAVKKVFLRTGTRAVITQVCLLFFAFAVNLYAAEGTPQAPVEGNPDMPPGLLLLTEYCDDCSFTVDPLATDPATGKCYAEVTYHWVWTPGGNADQFPYAVDAAVSSPATITSVAQVSGFGAWPSGAPFTSPVQNALSGACPANPLTPQVPFFPLQTKGWKSATAIPTAATLKYRIYLDLGMATSAKLWVRVLNWKVNNPAMSGAVDCWYACQKVVTLQKPPKTYVLTLDGCPPVSANCFQLGKGQWGTVKARASGANPPVGSVVKWYKRPATAACVCDPFTPASPSSWDPAGPRQTTVISATSLNANYPTNMLNESYCYVAVINEGCFTYVTSPIQVNVCPLTSSIGALTPAVPTGLDAYNHACMSWQGTTISFPDPGVCNYTVTWSKSTNGGTSWTPITTTTNQHELNISGSVGHLTFLGAGCNTTYKFKAAISYYFCNVLQQTDRILTIVIDKTTTPGVITALPWDMCGVSCPVSPYDNRHPVLCYGRATSLTYAGGCGDIVRWEYRDATSSTWSPWPGAGRQSHVNTNKLWATRYYRAYVKNGACLEQYSEIKVTVKPELTASVGGNTVICPGGSTTLTANTSYDAVGYHVDYQWRYQGNILPGAINKTYTVSYTQPGNYDVVVSDPVCKDTMSNAVTVCVPAISISGPAAICEGCSFTLTASDNGCAPCGTYIWTGPGGFTATGPSITTTLPAGATSGTYVVRNTCGGCPLVARFVVRVCP